MRPLLIGHRGAPGHYPEHTRSGYLAALAMGADAVEPDIVERRVLVGYANHAGVDMKIRRNVEELRSDSTTANRVPQDCFR